MLNIHGVLVMRIIAGAFLAGIIGWERDVHQRPAGFRTHLLVGLASATFMTISTHFEFFQGYRSTDLVNIDTSRIAASIVSGIGFLAGGAILRTGLSVQGMTTAAGLWLCAAIGMSAGCGMYVESVLATMLGVVTLTVLRSFEPDKKARLLNRLVQVTMSPDAPTASALRTSLEAIGVSVKRTRVSENLEKQKLSVSFHVRCDEKADNDLLACLESSPGIRRIRVQALE